jgi:hypothetical protein
MIPPIIGQSRASRAVVLPFNREVGGAEGAFHAALPAHVVSRRTDEVDPKALARARQMPGADVGYINQVLGRRQSLGGQRHVDRLGPCCPIAGNAATGSVTGASSDCRRASTSRRCGVRAEISRPRRSGPATPLGPGSRVRTRRSSAAAACAGAATSVSPKRACSTS